ncbi:MAG TPA: HPF/RaiA family ribosome-associated protein [Burkholderiales bacterium]|nr:HPF/RaiA family ribosome-associated protein [Burkholderiales bacterium]
MTTKRKPLAARIPRAAKTKRNRHEPSHIPAYIRAEGAPIDADDRAYLRRKLGMRLGKFARAVERVSVRIRDVNGPRGGVDKACTIKVVLAGLPTVVVEEQHASLQAAMDRALQRIGNAVRRSVERRVTRSRKR